MQIKRTDDCQVEILTEGRDFYVNLDDNTISIDVFDADVDDSDEAYLGGDAFSLPEEFSQASHELDHILKRKPRGV